MKVNNYLIFLVSVFFLSACGVKSVTSASVQADIVSVAGYKDYSCKELAIDALNIQNRIPEISSVIDKKKKDNDAYIATAVVFMPILAAGIKGNQEEAAQLALYKGQLNAIRQAAIMKDCEIIVQ
jgi:hypothetical protein|tara:strand:+ start:165 stop:539 length:375 start_codon:yes stop_codon:yes gene_type:complete